MMGDQPGSDKVFKEKCEPWSRGSFTCTLLTWIIEWYFHFIKINILRGKVSLASETVEPVHFSVSGKVKSSADHRLTRRVASGSSSLWRWHGGEGISHLAWQFEFNYLDPPGGRREISPISCPLTFRCIPMAFIFHPHNKWKVKQKNKPKHGMVSLLRCLKTETSISPLKLSMGHSCSQFVFMVWLAASLFSPFCICKHYKDVEIQQNCTPPHSHSHINVHLLIHIHTYRHTYTVTHVITLTVTQSHVHSHIYTHSQNTHVQPTLINTLACSQTHPY